ncbi:MAG: dicarboxylate/amino acid:cation symporter [Phycisphaeraceae bacterium]|nr:dicarboxylate/amino acid:cation symporter [Phycisphaeraceae bacterium]
MKGVWRIVIGLIAGILVGALINALWTDQTWLRLGVTDAAAFKAGKPVPAVIGPDGAPVEPIEPTTLAHALRFAIDANWLMGQGFIRALRFLAVPIVFFSIVAGVASLGDPRKLGRLGGRAVAIYICTSLCAVTIGLIISRLVRPGKIIPEHVRANLMAEGGDQVQLLGGRTDQVKGLGRQILDMIPVNPFDALARADMLQVIVFGLALGLGLTLLPKDRQSAGQSIARGFDTLAEVMGILVRAVMFVAPLAVFCLLTPIVAEMGLGTLRALGAYCLCVIAGLITVIGAVYFPLVFTLGRTNPWRFVKEMMPANLVAFSSSSSNATLAVTMRCLIDRLGVSKRVAGFVCPLGATINMDGTAVYLGIAVAFIAQALGVDLTIGQQLTLVVTVVLASIGSPGIPGGSLVILIVLLQGVGVPAEGIALILGVDRILDMARTVVNVLGDGVTTVIVNRLEPPDSADPADSAPPAASTEARTP